MWSVEKVIEEFVKPIGLGDLQSLFIENNITGDVLLVRRLLEHIE